MNKRLKILVSAYACSPYQGSEPGVGWGFVDALAARHDLWVIVEEEKFRADIERFLRDHPDYRSRATFHFLPKTRKRWLRTLWPPSYYWFYHRWHRDAFRLAERLHAEVGFDVVHQLTMVGFREPGLLWKLGVPFVWGPVGGMGVFPWRFLNQVGLRGGVYYFAYNVLNRWQARWATAPRQAARVAGRGLIVATPENQAEALRNWGNAGEVMCEVGLPRPSVPRPPERKPQDPLVLVWSGQHTPRKALNLGLKALARLPREIPWRLDILGHGSETRRWRKLAERLGVADRCHFLGWLERAKALDVMTSAHVMLITSLRDLTSTVTVEGLALGLPVVCPNHCGFESVIDETCGIKISVRTPRQFIAEMALALEQLARNEDLRHSLGLGALRRAEAFAWPAKAACVDAVYQAVRSEAMPRSSV